MYMDAWMQYNWLNNTVSGEGVTQESYKSKGITASFEVGYLFNLGENAANSWRWFIQPQLQVIAMEVKADEHTETSGTHVSGEGHNNTQTRLGVRVSADGYSDLDKGKNRVFQPFAELNWIYNNKDFGTQLDGISVKQAGAGNIAELKLGVEGQLSQRLNLWGNIAQQVGNKGYSDSTAMLGLKYSF
jgi:autotransporter family porin